MKQKEQRRRLLEEASGTASAQVAHVFLLGNWGEGRPGSAGEQRRRLLVGVGGDLVGARGVEGQSRPGSAGVLGPGCTQETHSANRTTPHTP
jgi:hypothetical protein